MNFRKLTNLFACAVLVILVSIVFVGCLQVQTPDSNSDHTTDCESETDAITGSITTNSDGLPVDDSTTTNALTTLDTEKDTISDIINPNGADYSLITRGGLCYVILENEYTTIGGGQVLADVLFSSMKEFKDTVTQGKLSDSQKALVSTFAKDENGILTCDFNNLYVPVLPTSGVCDDDVSWGGESYDFYVDLEGKPFGFFSVWTKRIYDQNYKYYITDFFDRNTIRLIRAEELGNGKTAFYYSTGAGYYVEIRYTLEDNSRTFVVSKTYRLNSSDEIIDEATKIPEEMSIYGNQGDVYYKIKLYEFESVPTDEWILQFGVKKYVENSHVIK